MHILHTEGVKPLISDKEAQETFRQLKERYRHSELQKMVVLRKALFRYDAAANEEDQAESL